MAPIQPMTTRHRIHVGKDIHKFSCAHMTVFPDGTKERIHGHNFQVSVALDLSDISFANLVDFADLKRTLFDQCMAWDQMLILADKCPKYEALPGDEESVEFRLCGKRYLIPKDEVLFLPVENIVVETLAVEFAHAYVKRLGPELENRSVAGLEVDVCESGGQGGTYYWLPEGQLGS